jgi:hypothetical protein
VFRFQQPNSAYSGGIAYEMDFLSPVLTFSRIQIDAQISGFGILRSASGKRPDLPPAEIQDRTDLWQS